MPDSHALDKTRVRLPRGVHIAATWSIPESFAGMTGALLQRSAYFACQRGVRAVVATFDPELDLGEVRPALRDRGFLESGLAVRNVWEDLVFRLGRWPRGDGSQPQLDHPLAAADALNTDVHLQSGLVRRSFGDPKDGGSSMLFLRTDGTPVVSLRQAERPDGRMQRETVRFGRTGNVERTWSGLWRLYRSWLDALIGRRNGYIVLDSKSLVPFFATYRNPHAVVTHLIHGAHLEPTAQDANGPIVAHRRSLLELGDKFDALVLLTESQRDELVPRLAGPVKTAVIPNAVEPAPPGNPNRDPKRGVMLAWLTKRKRVDHAVRAMAKVIESDPEVTLDIYGDGPERAAIKAEIDRLGLQQNVRLMGFVPAASERLGDYSFLLLTSEGEGRPLVIAEAMARGCIPIAYDIRYGPRDVIENGHTGFLVPDGNEAGIAKAVVKLCGLPGSDLAAIRANCSNSIGEFAPRATIARWNHLFRDLT